MTSFQCNGNNSRILFSIFRRMSPSWCLNMAFTSLLETKIGSQTSASMWDENLFTISTCNKKTYKYKNTHGQQQRKTQFKCSKWNIRIGFRIKHKSSKERKDISRALSWFTFFRASSTPKCLCNTGGKEALFKCHKIKIAIFARPPWEEIFWDYHRCDKPYIIIHRYSAGNEKCHILQKKKRPYLSMWVRIYYTRRNVCRNGCGPERKFCDQALEDGGFLNQKSKSWRKNNFIDSDNTQLFGREIRCAKISIDFYRFSIDFYRFIYRFL